ncbi:B12-binding domain-containing radical SAM protein [Tissierella sp. MB52-C2]|uniref:B12-binding domain-containing radical SAM protein n=1 Tax=Tissierella sp. MB52-C2 TaxID=3070999 RepID=UPI00280A659F|nr:B12-binding domain-containing radical SAM protein [Tissierella sp. MB52-C2]WMM23633.1 B12-binding domain-containing radical SAM protein [Tissierella sp. MB52-C2]
MKTILTTLNSKFVHSCLSIRYLKEYVRDLISIELKEYTINQNIDFIASDIYKENPDVIGFSTYIWNLTETLEICEILKIVKPEIKIILGGPEVSFGGEKILKDNPFIDFIVYGEGEETFKELMEALISNSSKYNNINGLIHREDNKIVINPSRHLIKDLNTIPSPYRNMGNEFRNKIVYFESSRGCPFGCEFCLSSTIKGVRYFSIERVKEELNILIDSKVKQVKFVDRTFNANKKYAMEIMNFIIDKNPKDINFHFEVTAHLLDREMLDFLSNVKEGLFQFEVGVQSTNLDTIEAVGRVTDFEKLRRITSEIKSYKNIHQHLDLIAGLPYEGYNSFRKSFNDVYEIKPEKIQLGFLKLLKGSGLRKDEEKYGFRYLDTPPYEVLENDFIKYGEIIRLKFIEDLVERYYNEGYFEHSLEYIINNHYTSPFDFYEDFSFFWEENEYHKVSNSRIRLYEILIEFYKTKNYPDISSFNELLRFDFIENNKGSRTPHGIDIFERNIEQRKMHEILKDERIIEKYLREYKDLPTKKTIKEVAIEGFKNNIFKIMENGYNSIDEKDEIYILFVYQEGVINRCKTYDVTYILKELI